MGNPFPVILTTKYMAQEKNVACICPSIMIYNEWVRENAVKESISGSIMKTKSEDYASID
jgi:hypothetical protein